MMSMDLASVVRGGMNGNGHSFLHFLLVNKQLQGGRSVIFTPCEPVKKQNGNGRSDPPSDRLYLPVWEDKPHPPFLCLFAGTLRES